MITRILRTIECENGELRFIVSGQRFLLARCRVTLEITENRTQVPSLGVPGGGVKSYQFVIAVCGDVDYTRKIDEDFLRTVDCYEVSADVFRRDGVYETMAFSGLQVSAPLLRRVRIPETTSSGRTYKRPKPV